MDFTDTVPQPYPQFGPGYCRRPLPTYIGRQRTKDKEKWPVYGDKLRGGRGRQRPLAEPEASVEATRDRIRALGMEPAAQDSL